MYVVHDDSFLPTSLCIIVLRDEASSNHFHTCLDVCNHLIDMFKSLLGKPPLCLKSSLFLQPHFDSLMDQILVSFSQQVDNKWVKSWDTTLWNIKINICMCRLSNAQWRHGILGQFSQVMYSCNVLLIYAPLDKNLLECQSYRYAKMWQLRDDLIINCVIVFCF